MAASVKGTEAVQVEVKQGVASLLQQHCNLQLHFWIFANGQGIQFSHRQDVVHSG